MTAQRLSATPATFFVMAALAVATAGAQATQSRTQDCLLQQRGVTHGDTVTHAIDYKLASGRNNTYVGGGLDAFCSNSDQRIRSDSAENYGDARLLYLIGHVHYTEAKIELTADKITYFMAEERLLAEGNVVGRTSTGTHFSGPRAVYLRAKPGLRARSRLDAGGRPDTWVSATDAGSDAKTKDSTHVLADSVISDNDSLVYAIGKVVIERPDLGATGDSAMLDQGREFAALRKTPHVVGRGDRRFTLDGAQIDIFSRNRSAERVRSNGDARATSDEVLLVSDTIDLRIADQKVSRAIAWGKKLSRATEHKREITADSIDIDMPGQVLRQLRAIRNARAESPPDSMKIRSKERDWFSGDTIRADFDTTRAKGDTAASTGIRHLVATGSAKSYQQAARESAPAPDSTPAANYMSGGQIIVDFASDRTLDTVRVIGKVSGVLIQPAADSSKAKPKEAPPTRRPPR